MTSPSKMSQEAASQEKIEHATAATASLPSKPKPSPPPLSPVDGSPKKRACEGKPSSPPSNKKAKENPSPADSLLPPDEHGNDADPSAKPSDDRAKWIMEPVDIHSEPKTNQSDAAECQLHKLAMNQRTDNDIFFGGRHVKDLPGNKKYHELLDSKKALYQASSRKDKNLMAMDIVREWRAQEPPGRFLKSEDLTMFWYDVGDELARKNVAKELGKGSRKKQRDSNDSNGTVVSFSDEDAGEKENIHLYHNGSMYNDVLSFFAATPFDAESMLSLHDQKERRIQRKSLILPSRASLPIVPQKKFMSGKAPTSDDVNNDRAASPTSSDSNEKEVSKFLLEEAKYLVEASAQLSTATAPRVRQALPQSSVSRVNVKAMKHSDGAVAPISSPSLPQNGQCPITQVIQNTSLPLNSNHGHSSVMASYQAQVNNPHTAPKIAMSSKEINASAVNVQKTAKMPVAFGFHLNDNDASKHMAQAATDNWKAHGAKATKSKGTGLRVSIDGKHGNSVCFTPKVAKTPTSSSTTPKTPKTPAILLSTEATPNLPTGWVSKTFQRTSGKSAGHRDTYFYSPQKEIKFRSMKGCKTFILILDEPGVDGNETRALHVYKERGHRF